MTVEARRTRRNIPSPGTFRWKLPDFLREHRVTPAELVNEIGAVSRAATIFRLCRKGVQPNAVTLPIVAEILEALERLTSKPVELSDILEYEKPNTSNLAVGKDN